ncbi:TIGR02996 domain-containing protein [Frigoriglobus tundricola]|uniref:TIGR02996 domain-containing protein n=1 Tax=Frigoriglobus tundricola TaxID=2774151 RepID=A0A6M5YHE1_9BACT|nr:TIGR02996 domain-containing protein [Frigoriglobus tundricola]QJW93378.1 hypothetical protein FTUN_0884 [Frigoriglobus tundricola]
MPRRPWSLPADAPYPPGWEPFLAAIKAEMFDDTPRLVFADWLQENGDEDRAEFIRLQCRRHPLPFDDPAARELDSRIEALLKANMARWLSGFPSWFRQEHAGSFTRGFVTHCAPSGARFLKDGAAITRLTPIDALNLRRVTAGALRAPALAEVGGLFLAIVDSARVEALAGHPNLGALRYLFLSNGIRNDLSYRQTVHLGRAAVRALVANPSLGGLQQFELNGTKHGDAVTFGIAAGAFARLEGLALYHSNLSPDGLKALVTSAAAPSLSDLCLAGNHFSDAGVRHLVESRALRRLECLNFVGCGLTAESARLLADWPGLRTVRWLELSENGLSEADADLIRGSPHTVALTYLGVGR